MKLSRNLTLEEFISSKEASEHKINNSLPDSMLSKAVYLACFCFEPIRSLLGDVPITLTSGYRCEELNKLVRGVSTSQHCKAEAFDFIPSNMTIDEAFEKIKKSSLTLDQLIKEHSKSSGSTWIHVSMKSKDNRKQIIDHLEKI